MKCYSFREFLANRWASESETISMCVCVLFFTRSAHTTIRLTDSRMSDLNLLWGGAAVTQRSRALTECSHFLFRRSSICFSGGGFFLACEDFGRMFDHTLPACAFSPIVGISSHTLIPLFAPRSVYSGSAESTVTECFLTSCV